MSESKLSNPAPLGLMGFGMTTVLLNLCNAGITQLSVVVLSMGLLYGGIGQVIAGILEYKRGNTFGTVAFTSYGLFWISLVFIFILPNSGVKGSAPAADAISLGYYFLMWGILSFFLFIGTFKLNWGLVIVFFTVLALFWLLAAANLTGISSLTTIAGWEGIVCGASAIYVAMAEVLNEVYGRTVLWIGAKKAK